MSSTRIEGRKIALRDRTITGVEASFLRRETGGGKGTSSLPLLNYYLASLYQVRRGGNATVVRQCKEDFEGEGEGGWSRRVWREHGTTTTTTWTNEGNRAHCSIPLLLYILLPDVDSTDLHKETYCSYIGGLRTRSRREEMFGECFPLVSCTTWETDVACRLSRRTLEIRYERKREREECQYVLLDFFLVPIYLTFSGQF